MKKFGDWLGEKKFTLALSSSFFGFFAHAGVAAAFKESGLQPARLSGSSAGALIAGAMASGMSTEDIRELLFSLQRQDFWDPFPGPGLLRGKKFLRIAEKNFVPTFAQAKVPLEVAVFDLLGAKTRFLDDGALPRAVVASCAVPLLFQPVRIGGRVFVDGGLFHKTGANPKIGEKVLCVFLQNRGLAGAYEWKSSKAHEAVTYLRFEGLPQLHFNALDRGKKAYSEARERTLRAFELPYRASQGSVDA